MPALMNEADHIERFSLNFIIQKIRERTTTTARIPVRPQVVATFPNQHGAHD
jgi:hypothetical protein